MPLAPEAVQLPGMRSRTVVLGIALIVAGCADSEARYTFASVVTACETEEWAATRADLIEDGQAAEAERFSSNRCFNVDITRPVQADLGMLDFIGGDGRLVEVHAVDGGALEHPASVALRMTLGQPPRTTGWVQRGALVDAN